MAIVLGWPTNPEHGSCPRVLYMYQVSLNWWKLAFLYQQLSFVNSFLFFSFFFSGDRTSRPFSSSMLGFLSGLSLGRSCACCYSFCELICASAMLFLDNAISLKLSTSSGSYNLSGPSFTQIPEHWWEGCDKDISFRVELYKVSHSLQVVQFRISVLITVCCKKLLCWVLSNNTRVSPRTHGISSHRFLALLRILGVGSILWSDHHI